MTKCNLCPRGCGIDRDEYKGRCGVTSVVKVARAALHMWEEPCISGKKGSGTVFFSGCSLGCVYCQNRAISSGDSGKEISVARLGDIFLEQQERGAANINIVTGDHYIPQIVAALDAVKSGLNIPVVFNTSSYVNVSALKMLSGYVDVYLADYKYHIPEAAERYSQAPDYPGVARNALAEMLMQCGKPVFDTDGYMTKGLIVRHLVLPGNLLNSKLALRYLRDTYGDSIYISIMSQFTPCTDLGKYQEINRKLTRSEYERIVQYAEDIGIEKAFIQEGECAEESFIPQFDNYGV